MIKNVNFDDFVEADALPIGRLFQDQGLFREALEKFFPTGRKAGTQLAPVDKPARQLANLKVAKALEETDERGWKPHWSIGRDASPRTDHP